MAPADLVLKCAFCLLIVFVDKRNMYSNWSIDSHMHVFTSFPSDTTNEGTLFDTRCVEKRIDSHHHCSLKTAVEEGKVERRCDESC